VCNCLLRCRALFLVTGLFDVQVSDRTACSIITGKGRPPSLPPSPFPLFSPLPLRIDAWPNCLSPLLSSPPSLPSSPSPPLSSLSSAFVFSLSELGRRQKAAKALAVYSYLLRKGEEDGAAPDAEGAGERTPNVFHYNAVIAACQRTDHWWDRFLFFIFYFLFFILFFGFTVGNSVAGARRCGYFRRCSRGACALTPSPIARSSPPAAGGCNG
jgi:hypothetical protein